MAIAAIVVSVVGLVLSAVGWVVAYRLGLRAQRRLSFESAQNEAREELSISLRRFIEWCIQVNGLLQSAELLQKLATFLQSDPKAPWRSEERLNLFHSDKRSSEWLERLEDFEIFFPHTRSVRVHLLGWSRRLHDELSTLYRMHVEGCVVESDVEDRAASRLWDLIGFAKDLMIYVQNESFGRIAGCRVDLRQPADHKAPRLKEGPDHQLHIVDGEGKSVIG